MSTAPATATYRRDLGDGLIQRWSTTADTDRLAQLMGMVWRSSEDDPPNPRSMETIQRHMRGDFPLMSPHDCALVEDTRSPGNPIVACACLWHEEWAYAGIRFGVGRPESVATDPAYRNRGLVRALFEMVHARSTAAGHLVQAISGIPHFYRQFGYEYALDFGGKRVTLLSLIPAASESVPEPYTLRPATPADVPRIMEVYDHRRAASMVWNIVPERYWHYQIDVWSHPTALDKDPTVLGMNSRLQMIVDAAGAVYGYVMVAAKRWGPDLLVYALELAPNVNGLAIMPSLLRALQAYGLQVPPVKPGMEPLREISFLLGRTHPVYDVLGRTLAPVYEPPYAWYLRIPDVPAFIRHIAPALEQRLAHSVAARYTGELKLDFYRGGLHMVFDTGQLARVEPWCAPVYKANADARCPALVFLQLLFGYRSLDALRHTFPDVWVNSAAEVLLNTLFPARPSWVMDL